jgi:23S rRNA (uridine2552-2'-O)-methyltransferase
LPERPLKIRVKSARGRRSSSTRWLGRQLNDPYVRRARAEGWRSRAAFKLIELDRKAKLLGKGMRVLDLGSAPGGWAQVAARAGARVVAVDLQPVKPIAGVVILEGDVFEPEVVARIEAALGGEPADLILSDLAASATGQRAVDRLRAEGIGELVLDLAGPHLADGGALVLKLIRGAEHEVTARAKATFSKVRLMRPEATRKESSEIYLVAQGFRRTTDQGPARGPDDD